MAQELPLKLTIISNMSLTTKTIMPNEFWVIEDEGNKVGTIHNGDNVFTVTFKGGLQRYNDLQDLESALAISLNIPKSVKVPSKIMDQVHGFPTAWNRVYNKALTDKFPVFTKTEKSSSFHVAGHWAVKFPTGWTQCFCPKLNTVKDYVHIGPYKSSTELMSAMRRTRVELPAVS